MKSKSYNVTKFYEELNNDKSDTKFLWWDRRTISEISIGTNLEISERLLFSADKIDCEASFYFPQDYHTGKPFAVKYDNEKVKIYSSLESFVSKDVGPEFEIK